jgi:hypothetical protein
MAIRADNLFRGYAAREAILKHGRRRKDLLPADASVLQGLRLGRPGWEGGSRGRFSTFASSQLAGHWGSG